MVNVCSAGVCFTIDPVSGNPNHIVVEGNWGIGESIVQGIADPDRFVIDKETLAIEDHNIGNKNISIKTSESGTELCDVPLEKQKQPCIRGQEVKRIATYARALEWHYKCPQDTEWAVDFDFRFPDNVFMVQARPVTRIPKFETPVDKALDSLMSCLKRQQN